MKRKFNFTKLLTIFILIISIIVLIVCSIKIIKYIINSNETKEEIKDIEINTNIDEVEDNENTKIIDSDVDTDNPYWNFINMKLINVDFEELIKTNPDTVGWISVGGTNINYPFVQTSDNNYYLNHSFYKNENSAGWVFLDYRNNIENLDKNTIIYAHGRWDKTMFGTLKNILTNGWLNNTDNYVIRLSTKSENTLWQVFSVYRIPTTNDYLKINFSDSEFINFTNMLIQRSDFNFNTPINENDKILTLSTCYNDSDKVVLHAKLIKVAKK